MSCVSRNRETLNVRYSSQNSITLFGNVTRRFVAFDRNIRYSRQRCLSLPCVQNALLLHILHTYLIIPMNTYKSKCLNSLCCASRSQASSTRIPNPYHTVTACDRVISRYLYSQDYLFYCRDPLFTTRIHVSRFKAIHIVALLCNRCAIVKLDLNYFTQQ